MLRLSKDSKIWLFILEFISLIFVVGGVVMIADPEEEALAGWLVLIFGAVFAICLPIGFFKHDAATACPRCGQPGALVVTNKQFISSEPIIKTVDTYQGQQVKPYQVTGHRDHYIETLTCSHCGYSQNVRTWYDNWDVSV